MEDKSILEEIGEVEKEIIKDVQSEPQAVKEKLQFDMSFLTAKTGEGDIDLYIQHPLNYNKSKGMAQIIRGFTGLFGVLDLAIIDIIVGILQVSKEKKVGDIIAN